MKKHHLFLLIVSLLLVASLALPTTVPQMPVTSPIIYEVSDLNDFPGKIVENDTLYIKKIMDQLSAKEGKKIHFTISKQVTGRSSTPFPFDDRTVLLKGSTDDTAQEYYALPPLSPGTYDFIITSIRTSGAGIAEKPVVMKREVKVISKNDEVTAKKIREEGDNDT
jgi:hypothetical protein